MNFNWLQKIRTFFSNWLYPKPIILQKKDFPLFSSALDREVWLTCFYPSHYSQPLALLLLNDGQDIPALRLADTLETFQQSAPRPPLLVVGIHAGDRMQEYGTIGQPDYAGRGSRADAYAQFIREELLPALEQQFRIHTKPSHRAFAGFSLGGLSALDLVWNHPQLFGRVGVFSGSLWWRSKPFDPQWPDADRIAHERLAAGPRQASLRFWLQTGTHDETADRNNNGIIDAIDDTLDLIKVLENIGYDREQDIAYVEVEGGEHNPATWGRVMPQFLEWWSKRME